MYNIIIYFISTTVTTFLKSLPNSIGFNIYFKILEFLLWYERKWIDFYVNKLKQCKNYYLVLNEINNNTWCSDDTPKNFIDYVNQFFPEFVHC